MKENCPSCGEKLKRSRTVRTTNDGRSVIHRYRNCPSCGHGDRATYQPEILLRVVKTRRHFRQRNNNSASGRDGPVSDHDSAEVA